MMQNRLFQVFDEYFVKNAFREGFSLYPILLRPKSRGKISLRSSDPQDHPKIQPNYLTHPDDVKVLIEGKIASKHSFNMSLLTFVRECGNFYAKM